MSWDAGAADINAALTSGELQKVSGGQAAGQAWIADARTKLATARTIATTDPAALVDRVLMGCLPSGALFLGGGGLKPPAAQHDPAVLFFVFR
ncbi:hypothetical protein A5658_22080 [Mycobacterium sp. 1245111.1]|uniref:hypothetical protein n=1 Tax=Mycobacterium sp. 1245111.1 TaxID=1834073 RepID=UPI0008013C32|nr:hypothetical protein [Mycobacterium sp. 1245111.1]OBK40324.1 hypothetical protein A5658_22080 [Mycobacterium sp. 1245111.1]